MKARQYLRAWIPALAVVILLAGCDDGQEQQSGAAPPPPPSVGVVPVVRKEIVPAIEFVARVEAIDSVDMLARVEGFLQEKFVADGADVTVGQPLFEIEKAPYTAEADRLAATVERAEATLQLAVIERNRQAQLVERNAVAQSQLDEAVAREAEAKADVDRQKAELERAQLDLSYTDVAAPIDGRIGRTNFSVGDFVGPGSGPLVTVVQLDPIYVRVNVSDRLLLALRRGESESNYRPVVRLSDGENYPEEGVFAFADATVDPTTDTVAIRAEFPNPNGLLLPDQFVTLIAQQAESEEMLVVPQAAIQADQAGNFVLTVDDENIVQVNRVDVGTKEGVDWIIEGGLEEGQQVIVQGLQKVRPGVVVETTEASPPETASAES